MKTGLLVLLVMGGIASSAQGSILLADLFDNNDLATANQFKGGYYDQGAGSGEVAESGTVAQISNSSNKNDFFGMLSSNSVASSTITPETQIRTTWVISDSYLKAKTSSLIFTWQTSDVFTLTPEFGVIVDLNNQTLSMFANSTNNILDSVVLDPTFGDDGDFFSLTATFSETGFEVRGSDDLKSAAPSNPLLASTWGASLSNTDEYRAGVFVNAIGQNGLIVDVDSITIEAIPEPAVLGLITVFGGGIILFRRLFYIGS